MRITFFKTPHPKHFEYRPRFYNEQKEEAENRRKRIEAELGVNTNNGGYTGMNRGIMSARLTTKRRANKNSTLRLMLIVAILLLVAVYFIRDSSILKEATIFKGIMKLFTK